MKMPELVFIPIPGMGHLVSTVETAKLLIELDERLSIKVLIIKPPFESNITTYIQSLSAATSFTDRIRFIDLPQPDQDELTKNVPPHKFFADYIESHKPLVKEAVLSRSENSVLAGFVIDMFCIQTIDVITQEFGVPSYVFFTSGAAFLSLLFYLQHLQDEQNIDVSELKDSDSDLLFPGFVNPLPIKVVPKRWIPTFCDLGRRIRETKGVLVNSFMELEFNVLESLTHAYKNIPPIYPVGPILNLKGDGNDRSGPSGSGDQFNIMQWLNDQPPSSVVFLCFGSMGSFGGDQVKEIAHALEQSGYRFLWSLRKPQLKGTISLPIDYSNLDEVLPAGFLDRTAGIGKVIGWAPQVSILAHPAIGGFVSHCGWNSTLESIWFGVPIVTWPIYSEQQFNAFQLVNELGLAVEITIDYMKDPLMENEPPIVIAEEIKRGIVGVMRRESDARKKMKEMSEKSRKASIMGGGSSYSSLQRFISHVLSNIS